MKRIAILGCENSHADRFLKFVKEHEKFKDVEIVGIYSDEIQATEKLRNQFNVPVFSSYDEAVGKVDGIVITARHGDNHYKYAKPYIASGIPMFIDKPITISESEAIEFMQECQKNGVRLAGGSSCKHAPFVQELKAEHLAEKDGKTLSGFVRCPLTLDSPYGGFYFYAQHLVEIVCEIYGKSPRSVNTYRNGEKILVVFRYENYDVTGLYVDGIYTCYYVARVAENHVNALEFAMGDDAPYIREFEEFYGLLCGAKQLVSYKEFIAPVFIMNAIWNSLQNGVEVEIKDYGI